ncbi:hypothetical protein CEXT_242671 [Caerostris extrusa]|uniref:Uncharacterized protein n=1 Tax=Caerostris extrusa TaxID=172846 RepID=A0AAV4MNY6_CAEEX|nr:hypothetical protein CEXT_242671 [Caerostris extrusa]
MNASFTLEQINKNSIDQKEITFSLKRENVPQINRTAKEDKMLSPKSINLSFCGQFFSCFVFAFHGNVAGAFVPEESRRFYGGVEWRLWGFVRDFGNALSKGSARGFQLMFIGVKKM